MIRTPNGRGVVQRLSYALAGLMVAPVAILATAGVNGGVQPDPLTPPPNRVGRMDPTFHAIRGATVHTAPGQTLVNATVVFREGRIVAVEGTPAPEQSKKKPDGAAAGEAAAADAKPTPPHAKPEAPAAPAGARVWDGTGLHVYAAFVDPFVEVDAPLPDVDKKGVHWNTRVTPQRTALDGKGIDEATARTLRSQGFGSAAISPRGGVFRGSGAVVSLARPATEAAVSRPMVYARGVYNTVAFDTTRGEGGEGRWDSYPSSEMGAIALVRQTLMDADWHLARRRTGQETGPENALDALRKHTDEALAEARDARVSAPRQVPLFFDAQDELQTLRAYKILDEFSRFGVVVGSGTELRRLAAVTKDKRAMVVPVNFPDRPRASSIGEAEALELRELLTWEQAPTNPRRLDAAGMTIAFTTHRLRDKAKFIESVRLAVRHGLPEARALAALTTHPAMLLGVGESVGAVRPGFRANLLVTDGPLFAKKTKVRDVWADGQRHEVTAAPSAAPEGLYDVKLTPTPEDGATRTMVIEKDNAVTLRRLPAAEAGKPAPKEATSKARSVTFSEGRLSFVVDHDPLGAPGVFTLSGLVEREGAATVIRGDGVRTDGGRFQWVATRTGDVPAPAPRGGGSGVAGKYRVTQAGGKPADPAGVITIGDKTVEVESAGKTQAAEDVKIDGDGVSYALDMKAFGGEGKVVVTAKRDGELLKGTMKLPDGTEMPFEAARQAPQGGTERRGPRGGAREGDTPADPVSGSWSLKATGDPLPAEGVAVAAKFKLEEGGKVTGTVTSARGSGDVTGGVFDAATGALSFGVTVGDEGLVTVKGKIEGAKFTGATTVQQMAFAIVGTRDQPRPGTSEEEEEKIDVPEKLPGLPFGAYAFEQAPAQPDYVLIVNATVWTAGPEGIIENGEVVIKKGKIDYAGKARSPRPEPPVDGIVIDAKGKHVTPGIIDCHSHTGISRGVNEGGQAVTAEVRIGDVTNPDAINWYRQLAGGVTAVNNLHGSANAIGGQNQVNKLRWGVEHPDQMHLEGAAPGIKFALGENPKGGNSSGERTGAARYPQTRMGVESIIRDRFIAAREYARAHKAFKEKRFVKETIGPRRDLELEALAEILEGVRLVHCHSYRQDEILMLALVAEEFGFRIGTYQHILEGYKVAEYIRRTSIGASGFSDWWGYKVEVQDAIPQGFPIMHEEGVLVSLNSDSDEMARRMNVEAAKGVKYSGGSVDEAEAIKWITINPAKQLKVDHLTGSLEKGKDADVVIWSGPPLSGFSRVEQTWVDGRCYFSIEMDRKLRERNHAERQRLIQKLLAQRSGTGGPSSEGRPEGARPGGVGGPAGAPAGPGRPGGRQRPPQDAESDETITRRGVLAQMLDQAFIARREYYLDMMRRGIDPANGRVGDCGCFDLLGP